MNNEQKENLALKLLGLDSAEPQATTTTKAKQIGGNLAGKVCMFRTYSAGVHFGELVSRDGKECLIANSRRVYYWVKAATLSQLAIDGSGDIDTCQIAKKLPEILLTEVIEIIPMSDVAVKNLYGAKEWEI